MVLLAAAVLGRRCLRTISRSPRRRAQRPVNADAADRCRPSTAAGSAPYGTLVLGLLGSASLLASAGARHTPRGVRDGVMAAIVTFFLCLVLIASPFERSGDHPADGLGFNPVLRTAACSSIRRRARRIRFVRCAIRFAAAALLANRIDSAWIAHTRLFALLAWSFQTTGPCSVCGGRTRARMGRLWGWDPVENVALMPWLATTAYLHSAQVQERRGRLRAWNFASSSSRSCSSCLGPSSCAAGSCQSVHTLRRAIGRGSWILAACLVFSGALLAWPRRRTAKHRRARGNVSREGAFTLQNLLLIGVVAVVFWGTCCRWCRGCSDRSASSMRRTTSARRDRCCRAARADGRWAPAAMVPGRGPWLRAMAWPAGGAVANAAGPAGVWR